MMMVVSNPHCPVTLILIRSSSSSSLYVHPHLSPFTFNIPYSSPIPIITLEESPNFIFKEKERAPIEISKYWD